MKLDIHLFSYSHAYIKVLMSKYIIHEIDHGAGVRSGSRGGSRSALLHVLCVASLLDGLPGNILLDVLTLLPGGGAALPPRDVGAVLLVHILSDGGGDAAANLVRYVIADLARGVDIIADLRRHDLDKGKK